VYTAFSKMAGAGVSRVLNLLSWAGSLKVIPRTKIVFSSYQPKSGYFTISSRNINRFLWCESPCWPQAETRAGWFQGGERLCTPDFWNIIE